MKLNNYKLLEKIGFGAFGEVYKVENNKTKEIYAAKISTKYFRDLSDDFKKNFTREVDIIQKIHHPSIVKFIGLSMKDFNGEDKPIIVTEYLPNGSLGEVIEQCSRGCAPENWNSTMILINMYGIAAAMSFLHENKIIHRDLKPENILLDEYLFPVIADFGLSKDSDIEASTIQVKGTPVYIAPEIWLESNYSFKSDVYAFAYVVYEMITNKKPFNTNITMFRLSKMICQGKRPDISSIPEPYSDLIERCWQQEPDSRPSFKEIVEELENNEDYITDLVEEEDFQSYINYIKESSKSFDSKAKKVDFNSNGKKAIKKTKLEKKMIYPEDEFDDLPKKCQKLITKAKEDTDIQYEVGYNLVRGFDDFPKNVEIGIKYIQQAIKGGSMEAVIAYNRMLIIGKIIPKDIEQARENLEKYNDQKNTEIIFLQAMIEKADENYPRAIKLLKKSINAGHGEAMFELGKMLYLGDGCEQNIKEAERYFNKAKENGCNKSDKFIKKQKSAPKKPKIIYDKKIDLVILIDGQKPNKIFYEAVSETITKTAKKITKKYPKILFRFGAVIYRDLILSQKMKKMVKDNPIVFDLTQKVDEIKPFFDGYRPSGGGSEYLNDWAHGYAALTEEISWDEKADKIVIQIGGTPGYGKFYSMKKGWIRKFFKIPSFRKENSKMQNERLFQELQEKQNGYFYHTIINIAEIGAKFYCINTNKVACYCYNEVANVFKKKNNKSFIIKDIFNFNSSDDDVDTDSLENEISDFFLRVADLCAKNRKEDNDEDEDEDDDDDDDNNFERDCRKQFEKDLNMFILKLADSDSDNDNHSDNKDDDNNDGKNRPSLKKRKSRGSKTHGGKNGNKS